MSDNIKGSITIAKGINFNASIIELNARWVFDDGICYIVLEDIRGDGCDSNWCECYLQFDMNLSQGVYKVEFTANYYDEEEAPDYTITSCKKVQ